MAMAMGGLRYPADSNQDDDKLTGMGTESLDLPPRKLRRASFMASGAESMNQGRHGWDFFRNKSMCCKVPPDML
jgi:hypothetical protein